MEPSVALLSSGPGHCTGGSGLAGGQDVRSEKSWRLPMDVLGSHVETLDFTPSALGSHQRVLSRGVACPKMLLEGSLTLVWR